jgi:Ca2+-binding EF-hand superfamily protein
MRLPIPAAILIAALGSVFAVPVSAQDTRAMLPVQLGTPGSPPIANGSNGQPLATMVVEPVAMMIAACDADNDGRTTRAELVQCITKSFDAIDTGHKGSIGYVDYSDWALKWLGDRNALPSPFTVDSDGDNRVTLTELQAEIGTLFTRFDTDKDGAATRAELLTIRASVGGDRPPGKRGKRGG